MKDHPHLGFEGEWTFVKKSYAMNYLVPYKYALVATDRRVPAIAKTIDHDLLAEKQEKRLYNLFVDRLKNIQVRFDKVTSKIGKNVAPVTPEDVLEELKKQYGLKVDLEMGYEIDTLGEHLVQGSLYSARFDQNFTFTVSILIKERLLA